MSTPIENNTEGLLEILQTVNNLPEAGSGGDKYMAWTWNWVAEGKGMDSGAPAKMIPTISFEDDGIKIRQTSSAAGIFYCREKIDLTGRSVIHFEGSFSPGNSELSWWTAFRVWTELGTYASENCAVEKMGQLNGSFDLDVSALEGSYYIGVMVFGNGSNIVMKQLYVA